MPQNIQTPLDLFGQLIDPRHEGEPLYAYKERLAHVAEAMLHRDLSPSGEKPSWVEAREQELEGRVGQRVDLVAGGEDAELIEEGETKTLNYENLEDREGPFRWPEASMRGVRPYYGWAESEKGGVSVPGSLLLHEREDGAYMQPGYVDTEDGYYYVGARLESTAFHLPPGTEETVLVPWDIKSNHPHRIVVVDEDTVALEADDHTHHVSYLGEQLAFMGSGVHEHDITRREPHGNVFPVTTSANPNTGMQTETGTESASGGFAGDRFGVPTLSLDPVTIEVDEHKTMVSPHDFWRGHFSLVADDHSHAVVDWEVEEVFGHTHAITRPPAPETRALVPRLSKYEDNQLLAEMKSPYVLDLRVEDGWIVASVEGGFSEELRLYYETGELREVPYKRFIDAHIDVDHGDIDVGLTPEHEPDALYTNVVRAQYMREIIVEVRLEDKHTGGVSSRDVQVEWENEMAVTCSLTERTNCCGEVLFRIPVDQQASLMLTFSSGDVMKTEEVAIHDLPDEPQGYGFNYGLNYGM